MEINPLANLRHISNLPEEKKEHSAKRDGIETESDIYNIDLDIKEGHPEQIVFGTNTCTHCSQGCGTPQCGTAGATCLGTCNSCGVTCLGTCGTCGC